MKTSKILLALGLVACSVNLVFSQKTSDGLVIPPFREVPERKPAFPLKNSRSLYSDQDLQLALSNISKYSSARKIKDGIIKVAEYWKNMNDEGILRNMPDARVPRAFDLCSKGCPVHGDSVFKVGGTYPWIIDPKKPLKVTCPIGGETYPSNDFSKYYESGFKELGGGDYVDDGFGWVSPEGDRYWFVAHANQWIWYRHVLSGLLSLSQAYLLTGDQEYARKANLMLYRLAEIYPSMDHENQSRYGLMEKMKGNVYSGKILNRIWETQFIQQVAEAYDYVWDYFDKNTPLQKSTGKSGEQIRAFIEANVLEDGLDAIDQGKIAGNFGMHQNAMLALHLVRQHAGKEKAIELMAETPSSQMGKNGFSYALYNQVFRDGIPLESPGYNAHWLSELVDIAAVLKKGGKNMFESRRFKSLLDAPLDIVSIGKFTPDWGDGGSVIGGLTARYPQTYQIGYNEYKDPRYLNWLGISGDQSFTTFTSLFTQALPASKPFADSRAVDVQRSRLFGGYGLGIINDPTDKTGLALTYGIHYSHYHWDFLNVELFANGQKMMPDLGYPDAMNTYVSPVYTWSSNTISHNTVVVDEKRQLLNVPGKLNNFTDGSFARVMDASSPAYRQVSQYRRNVVMVDAGNQQSYVVDFFHVAGGTQHDYSLHGPPGTFIAKPGEWSEKQPGTLAGENVEIGEIYDDENRRKNGAKSGYAGYTGSGFQHLFNVQKKISGTGLVEYHHISDKDARLRLHTLTSDLNDLYIADAYDLPRGRKHLLKYLIARRKSTSGSPLSSTFVSVFEPYKGENTLLQSAEQITLDGGAGHAVLAERGNLKEVVVHDTTQSVKKIIRFQIETDAKTAVVTLNSKGEPQRVFFSEGSYLQVGKKKFTTTETTGVVEGIDIPNRRIVVKLTGKNSLKSDTLVAHFFNAYRQTAHPVVLKSKGKNQLTFETMDDVLVGKMRVDKVSGETELGSRTSMTFQALYNGTSLYSSNYEPLATVKNISNGRINLAGKPVQPVNVNDVLWISNIGIGDEIRVESSFSWEK